MALAPVEAGVPAAAIDDGEKVKETPPYSEQDLIENGVSCYKCKKFTTKSWSALMEHLRRQHGIKWGEMAGTHLHRMARKEQSEKDKQKYQEKKQKVSQATDNTCDKKAEPTAAPPAAELKGNRESGEVGWSWKAMWVKVGLDGFPVWPLQVRDMTGPGIVGQPAAASGPGHQQVHDMAGAGRGGKLAVAGQSVIKSCPQKAAPTRQRAQQSQQVAPSAFGGADGSGWGAAAPAAPLMDRVEPAKPEVPGGDWISQLPKVGTTKP
jgi:hypothetical protein